ncbi:hypothetical protein ACP70R_018708 [Stipagrostis hirtigluma subsp. patula]
MEALREAEAKLTVYVHPSNAAGVRSAVSRQLSALLFSYEDRFDGVLLAHQLIFQGDNDKADDKGDNDKADAKGDKADVKGDKAKILKAKILNGLVPYFGVPVRANLLLFSPQPDMILEGKVEMLGKESIHAVVLGIFSAAIMSDDIREKFKFRRTDDGGKFVSRSDKKHVIKRGFMIRFSVKRVDTEMNCHITGSLIPPHTGSMHWLSIHDAEYASELKSDENRSKGIDVKIEQNEQEQRMLINEDSVMNSERPRKSRKRRVEER